jgi:hypothetical protein
MAGSLAEHRWPDFSDYQFHVRNFYEASAYAFAWIRDGEPTPQARTVIEALQEADGKGLHAEDYDGPRWPDRLAGLVNHPLPLGGRALMQPLPCVSCAAFPICTSEGLIPTLPLQPRRRAKEVRPAIVPAGETCKQHGCASPTRASRASPPASQADERRGACKNRDVTREQRAHCV